MNDTDLKRLPPLADGGAAHFVRRLSRLGLLERGAELGTLRAIADLVLLEDSFGVLPTSVMEGQRILRGMGDVMRLCGQVAVQERPSRSIASAIQSVGSTGASASVTHQPLASALT